MLHAGNLLLFIRTQIQNLHEEIPPQAQTVCQHFYLINMYLAPALYNLFHIRPGIRHIHILVKRNLHIFF